MRLGRDAGGAAHQRELLGILEQAHLVQRCAHVVNALRRIDAGAALRAHQIQPMHDARVPVGIHAWRVMQRRLVGHQRRQLFVELADGIGGVDAEGFPGGLRPEAESVPGFALQVFLAAEQHALRRRPGDQNQHRFGFLKAAEVVEVAVEPVQVLAVAVAHALGRGGHDGDAALHLREQRGAAFGVNLEIGHSGAGTLLVGRGLNQLYSLANRLVSIGAAIV